MSGVHLKGTYFFGAPTPDGRELFAIGEKDNEIRLFSLNPETLYKILKETCKVVGPRELRLAKAQAAKKGNSKMPVTKAQYAALRYRLIRDKEGLGVLEPLIQDCGTGFQPVLPQVTNLCHTYLVLSIRTATRAAAVVAAERVPRIVRQAAVHRRPVPTIPCRWSTQAFCA